VVQFELWQFDHCTRCFRRNNKCTVKTENPKEAYRAKRGFDSYNQQLTDQRQFEAQELFDQNIRPNAYHFLWKPLVKIYAKILFTVGLRDGKEGFIPSYVYASVAFKCYLKLWTLYRKTD